MPDEFSWSFIGSSDEEDIPGIARALALKGIDVSPFREGYLVTVIYKDGSKATFTKLTKFGTIRWQWTGFAWDSQGRPIKNRSGELVTNANIAGAGYGNISVSVSLYEASGASAAGLWTLHQNAMCELGETIHINGVLVSTHRSIIPCY